MRKSSNHSKENKERKRTQTEPRFPYTTKPSSLRRLLQDIPKKPRPPKFDKTLLRSWGFTDANDYSMIRVLKELGLLNDKNEPTDTYSQFMHLQIGASTLAEPVRRIYGPLFSASHAPYKESTDKLQNLFNIHSGGSERALEQQIQTFKAICENTSFDGLTPATTVVLPTSTAAVPAVSAPSAQAVPQSININVHIHLPENKSRRDYEAMIEDIGRYIFGRESQPHND